MRTTLAGLRGGALKAGQLLSTVDALFPPDPDGTWSQALTALQEDATPVPFATVQDVLATELGQCWEDLLPVLDRRPSAAASLGQVHRGTWHDGRDVAVKVQYPGVAEALAGDLAVLSVASRGAALVARGLTLPPLLAQMRTRLVEELDYCTEAEHQSRFATAYRDDPGVAVPDVVHATRRVLVQDWLAGTPLVRLAEQGADVRNSTGAAYQRFLLSGPERVGLLHTDPHPGNFRRTPDGRLGVLDFGSTLELPGGMPRTFGRLIRLLLQGDAAAIERGLRAEGFVRPGTSVDAGKLADYLAPFTEPARHERFGYSPEWLRGQFARVNDPRDPDFAVALRLDVPPELLFTHRVWLGCVGVLCRLRATVPVAPELRRWLPGFAQ